MIRFLGNKEFYKKLAILALPIIMQQVLYAAVQIADNLMVGQLGVSSINGVSLVNQLNFIIIVITFGVMGGSGIFTAQFFGSKDYNKLKMTFKYKIQGAIILSIFGYIIFSLFGDFIISLYSSDFDTLSEGGQYLDIIRFGLLPLTVSFAITTSFREIGVTRELLYISTFTFFIAIFLNYILIFGAFGIPALGVSGAAIGTVFSRYLELLMLILLIKTKNADFRFKISNLFLISSEVRKKINKKVIPLTFNEIFWASSQVIILFSYSLRGESALASINITQSVSQIIFVIFSGLATSIAVLVGNNLGSKKLKEAENNAYRIIFSAFITASFIGLILFISAPLILNLYSIDSISRTWSIFNIRINSIYAGLYAMGISCYFTLRSGGDVRSAVLVDSGFEWFIVIPLSLILGYLSEYNIILMFLIVKSTIFIQLMIYARLIRKKTWIKNLTD